MYDLFITKDEVGTENEDAMLARKNFGFTCMSCEKNLVNLEGRKADYHPWSKLPFRDPTERMIKVGHGFSKMLSQLKPESINKSEMKQIRPASGRNLSLDPEIGKTADMKNLASSSLIDLNKIDGSQIASSSKLKVSKIKLSKKVAENVSSEMYHTISPQVTVKGSQLPKID